MSRVSYELRSYDNLENVYWLIVIPSGNVKVGKAQVTLSHYHGLLEPLYKTEPPLMLFPTPLLFLL